jgi:hypothetical protein
MASWTRSDITFAMLEELVAKALLCPLTVQQE